MGQDEINACDEGSKVVNCRSINNINDCSKEHENYSSLDECIALAMEEEVATMLGHVRGHHHRAKKQKTTNIKPLVFVRIMSKLGKGQPITLKCLMDTGASGSLMSDKYSGRLRTKPTKGPKTVWTTPGGELTTTTKSKCTLMLPEFHRDRVIEWDINITPKKLGEYDMIMGRDILQALGIKFDFTDLTMEWDGATVPMRDTTQLEAEAFYIQEPEAVTYETDRIKRILDAKYEKANLREVVSEATHLSKEQQDELHQYLKGHEDLFDGTLGKWKMGAYDVELQPDAKPYHAKAYPIPHIHTATLKMEVERLCKAGVLKQVNHSEWAAPTFIIPKKDGSVRFISDFRELNKRIKRKPYPLPKVQDLLLKLEGFQFATSLDLNMGYYHIELSPQSKKLCTIVLPWGKYEYQRLPMGLCNSPDIFQEKMGTLMQDLEYVRAYIDDLLVITKGSFEDHLEKLSKVLDKLRLAGLKVNVKKSYFAKAELEYLGYWITRDGIKPTTKKVNAIMNLAPPKTKKEVRSFVGMVNYYRDMWIRRSHVLAPLNALTSKTSKWKWGDEEQQSFELIKRILGKEVLLAYPDFSKEFVIYTDASSTQLGAVISQDNKPIAFYSRKLQPAQTRYTTTERELLSIVETLKEFRNILLGHKIIVHTDHKNLTCKNFNTDRVLRWRLILEEYGPVLNYVKKQRNIVADALSRLGIIQEPVTDELPQGEAAELYAVTAEEEHGFPKEFPLSYPEVQYRQQEDATLTHEMKKAKPKYQRSDFPFGDKKYTLITYNDKIVLPKSLHAKAVQWYHTTLLHPGEKRMLLTMGQHYTWPGMQNTVKNLCHRCPSCQLNKPKNVHYGHLPPKQVEEIPWERLCIDLIGPYTIGSASKSDECTLHCLTMIDPVTGWFEIAEIPAKSADVVINVLEQTWLTRYPKPTEIIMDRGREFYAEVQRTLKHDYGITRKLITTRNPQANAMVERAHQTLHNMISTLDLRGKGDVDARESWAGVLSAVAYAMRSTVHTTRLATPMQLVFGRDAILNIRFQADWKFITERRQKTIIQNNERENAQRIPHNYVVGDNVMVLNEQHRKYGQPRYSGPYTIDRVNDNGTVRLRQNTAHGGAVFRTWNIRNIHPYKD
jgi:RNase H-like domain found in reverse transcriptase/Reverse transcriptase (RNA-dependent DNA polymerase)/Integrase zinc binding domain